MHTLPHNIPKKIRIAKYIAQNTHFSRREAEKLITRGLVTLNAKKVETPATLVTLTDTIAINNKPILALEESTRVWIFHKPTGVITSKTDPKGRSTVYDFLPSQMQNLLYVGRLDYNSEGLLLFTNNGELVQQLTLARNQIVRIYRVKTFGKISALTLEQLKNGIVVNGIKYQGIEAKIISQNKSQSWLLFKLTEGKNKEIRKICEFLGLKVSHLIRTHYGPFNLNNLPKGHYFEIPPNQLTTLLANANIKLP